MKLFKVVSLIILFGILGNSRLLAQNLTLNANLLETNFGWESKPRNMNFISGDKLIFNTRFGITIKNSENEKSKLLIKISSAYRNYVNEDNTYSYDATKALYISVIDNNAYFFIKKNSKLSLWKTDGTGTGTHLIKEFPNLDFSSSDFVISSLAKFNNKLFFSIYHMYGSPSRSELWISDETSSGTEMVNVLNNNSSFAASNFVKINNGLYFLNYSSNAEKKIWKSDGTVNNTLPVLSGSQNDYAVSGNMLNYNGRLYFIKIKNSVGYLSYYNSTDNEITDVFTLPANINPYSPNVDLYLVNNSIVFSNNKLLWKSDGTTAGTGPVDSASYPNYGNLGINNSFIFKNKLYFNAYLGSYANPAILTYDGHDLVNLSNVFPELQYGGLVTKSKSNSGENNYLIYAVSSTNDYLAFNGSSLKPIQNLTYEYSSEINVLDTADNNFIINGGNKKYGQEIFKFNFGNGSSSIYENADSTAGSYFYSPQELNNKLFYFGSDEYGVGPMLTDGTVAGTKKISENVTVQVNSGSSYVQGIPNIKINDKIYFPCMIDGSNLELCVSDGTSAGTRQVKDINPNGSGLSYDTPYFFKLGLNKFLFKANDGAGEKLWVSDGTNAGTNSISPLISYNDKYAALGDYTFYVSFDHTLIRPVLMKTGGNQNDTQLFYDFGTARTLNTILAQTENKFFILIDNRIDSWTTVKELWVSDGTAAGTFMVKSFTHAHYSSPGFNNNVAVHDGKLYFFACSENQSDTTLHSPYVSDGTVNGTYKLSTEEFPNGFYGSYNNTESRANTCGSKVYFISKPNSGAFSSMWVYNNNQFSNVYSDISFNTSAPNNFTCINENLFFLNKIYTENRIWVTNGGQGGVKEININANGNMVNNVIINSISKLNNKLFVNAPFLDSDSFNFYGIELYVMDVSQVVLHTEEAHAGIKSDRISVLVFPNPAVSELNLASDKNNTIKSIEMYNMNGNLILSNKINNSHSILNLQHILSGVYLLKIQTEKGIIIKKVIKK